MEREAPVDTRKVRDSAGPELLGHQQLNQQLLQTTHDSQTISAAMADKHPFRIVIVGASVTGLSMANMLQANGIGLLVLEAYPTAAPQVGASIGLLPQRNHILDQLG
jgi:pyruvate/2-oxoglutarate dehydrogenase complex dihydrolipoamide dehydrogenase (E3) component